MTPQVINVTSTTHINDYVLRVEFDDGTHQNIDFGPFLMHSRHPDIRAYLQPQMFSAFRIEHGELMWGDYDLCFPVIDLYRNQIDKYAQEQVAA